MTRFSFRLLALLISPILLPGYSVSYSSFTFTRFLYLLAFVFASLDATLILYHIFLSLSRGFAKVFWDFFKFFSLSSCFLNFGRRLICFISLTCFETSSFTPFLGFALISRLQLNYYTTLFRICQGFFQNFSKIFSAIFLHRISSRFPRLY